MIPKKIHGFVLGLCQKAGLKLDEPEDYGKWFRCRVDIMGSGEFVSFFFRQAYVSYRVENINDGFILSDIKLIDSQTNTTSRKEDHKLGFGRYEFSKRGSLKTKGSYCAFHQLEIGTAFASDCWHDGILYKKTEEENAVVVAGPKEHIGKTIPHHAYDIVYVDDFKELTNDMS